jgi:hypothetical protein
MPNGLPFHLLELDATTLSGIGLWSLALYLGFSPISDWMMDQLDRWLILAERFFYTSVEKFEQSRPSRDLWNAFFASMLSVIPFLVVGGLCHYGIETSLGRSWSISIGILSCIGCGVYELGRRDGQASGEDEG